MFRAFAAHSVDGGINGSAERCTLGGMNHFIHRHDRLLSFLRFMALFYAFRGVVYIDKSRECSI